MNKSIKLTHLPLRDLPIIMRMIESAKIIMKDHQSGQWQGIEPSEQTLLNDISQNQYYGLYIGEELVGGCALLDYEADYHPLVSGRWLNESPYIVIHRFVIDARKHRQGLGFVLLQEVEKTVKAKNIYNIRVDTHELNQPMNQLLIKAGYIPCGQALLKAAGLRVVYHKEIGEQHE
jgi:GNAT superfamily N-acetyltransferase